MAPLTLDAKGRGLNIEGVLAPDRGCRVTGDATGRILRRHVVPDRLPLVLLSRSGEPHAWISQK